MSLQKLDAAKSGHHMTPQQEDNFEAALEGSSIGSMDDWEMDLGAKILKIEGYLDKARKFTKPNKPVIDMMTEKLVGMNAAIRFMRENPKAALTIGSKGGVEAIIEYITKAAQRELTREEMQPYTDLVKGNLPGFKFSEAAKSGLIYG